MSWYNAYAAPSFYTLIAINMVGDDWRFATIAALVEKLHTRHNRQLSSLVTQYTIHIWFDHFYSEKTKAECVLCKRSFILTEARGSAEKVPALHNEECGFISGTYLFFFFYIHRATSSFDNFLIDISITLKVLNPDLKRRNKTDSFLFDYTVKKKRDSSGLIVFDFVQFILVHWHRC